MVSARQLLEDRWTRRQIERAVSTGRLVRVHRGVFAVGHVPRTDHARWMAAVLTGPALVLSHRSAGRLHRVLDVEGRPDVLSVRQGVGPRTINRHWTRSLLPGETMTRTGIPCTTPARTLIDLADVLADDPWEIAVRSAERQRLIDRSDLVAIRGRRGHGRMLRLIDPLRSPLEAQFKAFLLRHGLPLPVFNAELPGIGEVDAAWPDRRVVIELDSWTYHGHREAFERDRARDAALAAMGWTRIRVTARMLDADPVDLFRRLLGLG